MQGKICMVTGANAGIGKETALALARMGATVVMVARNAERGAAALADVRHQSGNGQVTLLLADLSSQASIRQLVTDFHAKYDRLHVLVNNAGAIFMQRQETVDGLEMTFALNHLNYFLLTNLLLDTLKASAPARIVNVSSGAHYGGQIAFDDLQLRQNYRVFAAYSMSKLANVMFTYELARRLAGTGVTANCLHPGFVGSNFAKNNGLLARLTMVLMRPFALSPEKGAETSIYLASSAAVDGVSGKYFTRKKPQKSSSASYDEAAAQRLWAVSAELTGL
ncbi:MAG: SDR family oxidoreductase [Ardenticatenaceae bacterium]|nr:SDR family oxidoreductase [Ardenticatenaceae bacterium]